MKVPKLFDRFIGGISDFRHENMVADAYYFGRSVDVRSEPHHVGVLPRTIKESGTVITDLPKWGEVYQATMDVYFYGNTGNIYKRTSARSYSLLRSVANSHGNGLVYSAEDDFLYYPTDKYIGRYGPLSGTATFVDDFFGSQGGVPLNTNSLDLEASSSQYASRADTASLSITGDLSIDCQIKPESLPANGATMTLVSKWTENGNLRSYKFGIGTVSNYFGDGSDGALTIAADTTEAPIDSACTGTVGTYALTATNTSFAANQIILIHQTQGTGAGTWQKNTISSYTAGTINTLYPLNATYSTGAQVRVLKQYTNVTINSGKTYTAKAWNGTVGGIIGWIANGTTTITGTVSSKGKGFRGGIAGYTGSTHKGVQGESSIGTGSESYSANGSGGGGGGGTTDGGAGGGGGSHSTVGFTAPNRTNAGGTTGGSGAILIIGNAELTTLNFGGAGGGGGADDSTSNPGPAIGGNGGGAVVIFSNITILSGLITSDGNDGINNDGTSDCQGGGGAGGSVLIKSITATLGTNLITVAGGFGGRTDWDQGGPGGYAGTGRINIDYFTSYTGSTTPTLNSVQDNNLGIANGYSLFLSVSSNGTNVETLTRPCNLILSKWQQVGVSWDASASTATFYLNAISLGTATGTLTAISDNASVFNIGMDLDGSSAAQHFYDGLIDETRVYNTILSADDFLYGINTQIPVNSVGLQGYWKFNGDYTDSTANANNLTASGTPVFSIDVPYPSPTTRLDIDLTATTTGNTYTTPLAISEAAGDRLTITPTKDPQKSVAFLIAAVGTGNWTVTVHDTFNNVIATSTVVNALLHTGYYEFVYSSVWRPLTNFTNEYHFHITSTVADGTVTCTTASNLTTVSYRTYFQFLIEDTEWHPAARFLNFLVFGNERYLAKYEAPLYEPNKIVFGAGWRVRCFSYWQEYLAIGCMKGSNIYDFDQGRVYFWDGYSPTFNFYIDVPEGGINALLGTRGSLYIWAGYHADLLSYTGGSQAKKLKEVPLLLPQDYAEVYPGAVAMWMANPRYGLAGNSNSAEIQKGVYTWGSTNYRYEDILTYDYPISTSSLSGDNLKIGMILPVNQELLIGWQDGVAYGMDYVNVANDPYPTATIEMLIEDLDVPYKQKEAVLLVANFDSLSSGCSVQVKYMNDETDTAFHTNPDSPVAGDTLTRMNISAGRYNHIMVAMDLISSGANHPTVKSFVLMSDNLETEDVTG